VLAALFAFVGAASSVGAAKQTTASHAATIVRGGGIGVLTDPDGAEFPLDAFYLQARIGRSGSANGLILFVWRGAFAQVWGDPACDGTCDAIVLAGAVKSGSVAANGTVTLSGTAREVDLRQGRVVFDSGFDEPFSIVVSRRAENAFVLQWCLLPEFRIDGPIRIHGGGAEAGIGDERTTASLLRSTSCSR
jgi:hypothetical protein